MGRPPEPQHVGASPRAGHLRLPCIWPLFLIQQPFALAFLKFRSNTNYVPTALAMLHYSGDTYVDPLAS